MGITKRKLISFMGADNHKTTKMDKRKKQQHESGSTATDVALNDQFEEIQSTVGELQCMLTQTIGEGKEMSAEVTTWEDGTYEATVYHTLEEDLDVGKDQPVTKRIEAHCDKDGNMFVNMVGKTTSRRYNASVFRKDQ